MDANVGCAAHDNAAWCDHVCRAQAIATRWRPACWAALEPSPRFYPDAVTLREDARSGEVLQLIDARPGASVKDSFAALELGHEGFEVLFEAQWLWRRPAGGAGDRQAGPLRVLESRPQLVAWLAAAGLSGVLAPAVLAAPGVRVLAASEGGSVCAGAILSRSGRHVGVSNAFASERSGLTVEGLWPAIAARAAQLFPGCGLLGYERGEHLESALRAAFRPLGPLRVWEATSSGSPSV